MHGDKDKVETMAWDRVCLCVRVKRKINANNNNNKWRWLLLVAKSLQRAWLSGWGRADERMSAGGSLITLMTAYKLVLKMEMISSNDELIIIEIDMRRICKHDMRTTKIRSESNNSGSSGSSMNDNNLHACYSFNSLAPYIISTFNNNQCSVCSRTSNLIPTQIHSDTQRKVFVIDVHCFFFPSVVEIGFADARYACCALLGWCKSFFSQFSGRHCWKSFEVCGIVCACVRVRCSVACQLNKRKAGLTR